MSSNTETLELGTEKISKLLRNYAIPSIIAMTASSLYNIADSIFIGHGVGKEAIAALAITLPLMNLAAAFGAMVGIGASSQLSIKLGQSDKASALAILGNVVILNSVIGFLFGFICLLFLNNILELFGATPDIIEPARQYMQIILAGNIFTHLYLGLNNVLRAAGFPKRSMTIMIVAVITNCLLDWLFIFVFDWGIRGAAWATVIAQIVAMGLEFVHFMNPQHELRFKRGIFKLKTKIVKSILSIGLAPFLMNISTSIVVIFINNALKDNGGTEYIGAYGIVNRVAIVFMMVVFGLNQGMQPIVGYNYGARKYDRVRQTLKLVTIAATAVTSFGFLCSMLFPRTLAWAFTSDPGLIDTAAEALRIVLLMFPIVGFQVVISSFFQSIGSAHKAILLSLTRQLLFLLPLLIILPRFWGSTGVWMSMPIADAVSTILAVILLIHQMRIFKKREQIL